MSGTTEVQQHFPVVELSEVDEQAIRSLLSSVCPTTAVGAVGAGPSSYSNRLWLVETDEGPLLVRVPGRDTDPEYVRASLVAARLAAEAGVPAPRLRAFAARTSLGRPLVVQEFQPGEKATALLERDPRAVAAIAEAVGRWVGTLHHVRGAGFGSVLALDPDRRWDGEVRRRAADALAALPSDALPTTATAIENAVEELVVAVRGGISPSLVHGDLYFDNVLVRDGRPSALLDFEHAAFADRFADFGKINELLFEWWPASRAPFLAAYHDLHPAGPDDEVRTRLAVGLYELGQLAYFSRWQADLVPVYRDRLAGWLSR